MNHRNLNPCLAGLWQSFIILAQPTTPTQPCQCAFDDPSARQHLKMVAVRRTLDNLQKPTTECTGPLYQLSCIAAISPYQLESRKSPQKLGQHELDPVSVLDVRSMDDNGQKQSQSVYDDMALASRDLLARIVATRPPFSVVLTDWLSIMAALGVGSRPSASRTFGRSASWMRSQLPSSLHCRKYHDTVPQGGRS